MYKTEKQTEPTKWTEIVAQTDQKLYLGGNYYDAPMVYVKEGSGNWTLTTSAEIILAA